MSQVKYSLRINRKDWINLFIMLLTLMLLGILFGIKVKGSGNSMPLLFIGFWVLVFFLYVFKFIFTPYRIDVLFNDKAKFVGPFSINKTIPLEHINVIEAHRLSLKIVGRNSQVSCINNIENFDRFIYSVKEKNPYLIIKGL